MSYQTWLAEYISLGAKPISSQVKLHTLDIDASSWKTICLLSFSAGIQGWGKKTSGWIFLRTTELPFTDVLSAFLISKIQNPLLLQEKGTTFNMLLVLLLLSSFLYFWHIDPRKKNNGKGLDSGLKQLWGTVDMVCACNLWNLWLYGNKKFCLERLTTTTIYLVKTPAVPTS